MNWIDIVIALGIIFFIFSGFKKGFLVGLTEIVGIIVAVLFPFLLFKPGGIMLESLGLSPVYSGAAAFLMLLIAAVTVYIILAERFYRWIPERVHELKANKFFGLFTGLVRGAIIVALIFAVIVALPTPFITAEDIDNSTFGTSLLDATAEVTYSTTEIFGEPFEQVWGFFTIETETEEKIELNFTVSDPVVTEEDEQEMLELLNEERKKEGLSELVMDDTLRDAARKHSSDMFKRGYFAHVNPDGKTPFDRMRDEGITFNSAGENLALAPTVSIAHQGLMDSPGHRKNILSPQYNRVGIGAVKGGRYGIMFTQKFTN